jgi:hypothetical protein
MTGAHRDLRRVDRGRRPALSHAYFRRLRAM